MTEFIQANAKDIIETIFISYIFLINSIEKFKTYIQNRHYKAKNNINEAVKFNQNIFEKLVETRLSLNADRACIYQFHNGDKYLNAGSIMKLSCVFESVQNGLIKVIDNYHCASLTKFPEFTKSLIIGDILEYDYKNTDDFSNDFFQIGTEKMFVVKLMANKLIIGFLVIGYNSTNSNIDKSKITEFGNDISYLLSK